MTTENGAYGEHRHDGQDAYGEYGAYDTYGAPRDDRPLSQPQVALIDLLDRLLSGGLVITGDLVLSVADIDLVRISLRAVVHSVREQLEEQWAPILPAGTPGEYGDRGDEPH